MASGFFVKFSGGPYDGKVEWVIDGTTKLQVFEKPPVLLRAPVEPAPEPVNLSLRTGWYEKTGPQTNDGYIFEWRGWN